MTVRDGPHRGHAARNEYRTVRATMPFPVNPMETHTGLLRPKSVDV